MSCSRMLLAGFLAVSLFLLGCQPADDGTDSSSSNETALQESTSSPAGGDAENEALASLSAEDQALALKQKVCPVSGEELGSMGTPPKAVIDGRTVFLCCAGCEEMLRENPEKYLAVLDGNAAPANDHSHDHEHDHDHDHDHPH